METECGGDKLASWSPAWRQSRTDAGNSEANVFGVLVYAMRAATRNTRSLVSGRPRG